MALAFQEPELVPFFESAKSADVEPDFLESLEIGFEEGMEQSFIGAGRRIREVNKARQSQDKLSEADFATYTAGRDIKHSKGMTKDYADILIERHDEDNRRSLIRSRTPLGKSLSAELLGGFGAAVLSPENYIPWVGPGRAALAVAKYGRARGLALTGAADAAIGTLVVQPLAVKASDLEQSDYDWGMGAANTLIAGAFGGVAGAAIGRFGGKLDASPRAHNERANNALVRDLNGDEFDVTLNTDSPKFNPVLAKKLPSVPEASSLDKWISNPEATLKGKVKKDTEAVLHRNGVEQDVDVYIGQMKDAPPLDKDATAVPASRDINAAQMDAVKKNLHVPRGEPLPVYKVNLPRGSQAMPTDNMVAGGGKKLGGKDVTFLNEGKLTTHPDKAEIVTDAAGREFKVIPATWEPKTKTKIDDTVRVADDAHNLSTAPPADKTTPPEKVLADAGEIDPKAETDELELEASLIDQEAYDAEVDTLPSVEDIEAQHKAVLRCVING